MELFSCWRRVFEVVYDIYEILDLFFIDGKLLEYGNGVSDGWLCGVVVEVWDVRVKWGGVR